MSWRMLSQHKFTERCKAGASSMLAKIEKARQISESMALQAESLHDGTLLAQQIEGLKVNQDYGDTVPSKPINIGQTSKNEASMVAGSEKWQTSQNPELAGEGDFGTVVVHGGNETDKPFTQISPSIKEHSSSFEGATGVSTHGGIRESKDSKYSSSPCHESHKRFAQNRAAMREAVACASCARGEMLLVV